MQSSFDETVDDAAKDAPKPAPKISKTARIGRFFAALYPYAHFALPILAAILTLVNTHILLGPVLNRSGDNDYHLLNEFALLNGILGGDNPLGPQAMEFGQPILRFYQHRHAPAHLHQPQDHAQCDDHHLLRRFAVRIYVLSEEARLVAIRGICRIFFLHDINRRVRQFL